MKHETLNFKLETGDGFTLVELIVSVGIFVMMTALLVARYGTFNQSVLLTNLAYDVALTIRTAQTYGLSIKGQGSSFQNIYGVEFSTDTAIDGNPSFSLPKNGEIVLFASRNGNSTRDPGEDVTGGTYALKRGAKISSMCVGSGPGVSTCTPFSDPQTIDISFKRPDPDSLICVVSSDSSCTILYPYAEITLQATDGSTRVVSVRRNGQISVAN